MLGAVYPRARFVSLAETGHLLPYERASEVAAEIVELWESVVRASAPVAREWAQLIASDRTGIEARALLARRALADDADYAPRALSPGQLATLRALAARLVPQPAGGRVDLAARIDADLASARGDGWRPAELPDDASAYRLGLDAIAAVWPAETTAQDALIRTILAGELVVSLATAASPTVASPWSDELFRQWFDDVRNDLARTWLAHPASLARVGYDGFATSGPRAEPAGYVSLGAGVRDAWEPTELGILDDPTATTSPAPASQEKAA